jgi:hypothetical protein
MTDDTQLILVQYGEGSDPPLLTWCGSRDELEEAVKRAIWFRPSEAEEEEARGLTRTLWEQGWMRFEGDPPLQLIRVSPPSPSDCRTLAAVPLPSETEISRIYSEWERDARRYAR